MKKLYRCPDRMDLVEGNILEIYSNYKEKIDYQGRAKLLKKLDAFTPEAQRIYVRAEIGNPTKQTPHTVIWSWERWKVQFIDGPNAGWTTARKIAYYVTVSNYYEHGKH